MATQRTSRTTVSSPTTPPAVSPSTAPSATASARARSLSRPLISSTLTRRRDRRPSSCLQELRRAEEGVGAEDGCGGTRWAMIYLVDDFVMIFMYYEMQQQICYLPMLYCPHARVMQSQDPSSTMSTKQGEGKGKAHPHIMPRSLEPSSRASRIVHPFRRRHHPHSPF